jgi:ribonuclease HI
MYLIMEGQDMPLELQASGSDSNLSKLRNVAGEMMACCQVVTFLQENYPQYDVIEFYYDYQGIECWVTGEWRAKLPETQAYREIMRKAKETIKIKFVKVKAHNGVIYNERADRLAKDAVNKHIISMG